MVGKIVNHVPRLLKKRKLTTTDLMYGARLAAGTAYAWANEDKVPSSIDIGTLTRICAFLGVGVGDLLEFVPE